MSTYDPRPPAVHVMGGDLADAARAHNIAERARRRDARILKAARERTEPVTWAAMAHPMQDGQRLDLTTEQLGAIDDALMLLHLQDLDPRPRAPRVRGSRPDPQRVEATGVRHMSGAADIRLVAVLGPGFERETPIADALASELWATHQISADTYWRVRLGVPYVPHRTDVCVVCDGRGWLIAGGEPGRCLACHGEGTVCLICAGSV